MIGGALTSAVLATPAVTPASPVVWAAGDGTNGSERAKRVARMIARDRPARLLYLGDVYPNGSAANFRAGYRPVYGALDRITASTPGNHDWGQRDSGYFPHWRRELASSKMAMSTRGTTSSARTSIPSTHPLARSCVARSTPRYAAVCPISPCDRSPGDPGFDAAVRASS